MQYRNQQDVVKSGKTGAEVYV